jgi:hypothetical protein
MIKNFLSVIVLVFLIECSKTAIGDPMICDTMPLLESGIQRCAMGVTGSSSQIAQNGTLTQWAANCIAGFHI